jgi:hypothetical protein
MLRGLGGAICDPAKCLSCGECVEELAKALHFAVLECDEVNEVSLVLTACGPDSTLGVPHDGNRVQIGKKVSWLENQDFFGFVAHAQPLEEAFVPVPDSAGGVERVRRLTPLDARTEHVQDAGNVPDRERLVQRLDERDVLVRVRHVALLSGRSWYDAVENLAPNDSAKRSKVENLGSAIAMPVNVSVVDDR